MQQMSLIEYILFREFETDSLDLDITIMVKNGNISLYLIHHNHGKRRKCSMRHGLVWIICSNYILIILFFTFTKSSTDYIY